MIPNHELYIVFFFLAFFGVNMVDDSFNSYTDAKAPLTEPSQQLAIASAMRHCIQGYISSIFILAIDFTLSNYVALSKIHPK